jgi:hypothetical protein
MTLKSILLTTVLIGNASLMNLSPIMAQNPPAETYQPGFWQPVARVNPQLPIKIELINQSGITLDYAITESQMKPVQIAPSATATLNNVEIPLYIVIYPDSSVPNSSKINLKYFVTVTEENVVKVEVRQTEDVSTGNRTFNLQETGAIFLY